MSSDIPRFHDGLILGIRVAEKSATLFLRQTNNDEYALDLEGLEVLHIEDFRQSNIISLVEVVTRRAPDSDVAFDRLFGAPHPTAEPIYHKQYAATVEHQKNRIGSGETKLLIVVPSWGPTCLRYVAMSPAAECNATTAFHQPGHLFKVFKQPTLPLPAHAE